MQRRPPADQRLRAAGAPRTSRPGRGRAAPGPAPSAGAAASRSRAAPAARAVRARSPGCRACRRRTRHRWVLPVRSVSRCRSARSTSHGRGSPRSRCGEPVDLGERDLHLVDGLGPALVEARRLAGRADEPAGEEVGQRGVPLPVRHQAGEQVRPAQQRGVDRLPAAQGEVVAAAGAGVRAVEVELLGGQPLGPGRRVQRRGQVALLGPALGRLHVDLDDTGVRGDHELGEPRVGRRAVALEHHRDGEPVAPRPRRAAAGRRSPRAARSAAGTRARGRRAPRTPAPWSARPRGRQMRHGRDPGLAAAGPPPGTTARRRTPGPPRRSSPAAAAGRPRSCPA